MNKLIAVYGGSFNPPTIAHENIARQILSLDIVKKLIYLPVGDLYKKKDLINSKYRYDMLEILIQKLNKENLSVEINDLEINSNKRLYTIESLRILKKEYASEIAFVMGTDNIREFSSWYMPEELLKEFCFIVIERKNDNTAKIIENDNLLKQYKNKFIIIKKNSYKGVSSTYIRNNIEDEEVKKYIDKNIFKYIKTNKLYGGRA